MNREIKFRGQRIDTKEWVYGGFYEWNNKTYIVQKDIWDMQNFANMAYLIEVDPETVGQFIGFLDKGKTEIYTGDVVKHTEYVGGNFVTNLIRTFEVIYSDCSFQFKPVEEGKLYTIKPFSENVEVIGDIFSNPVKEG